MAPKTPTIASASSITVADDLVSIPDDLISEESDFHGSLVTRSTYNKLAEAYNPKKYWAIHEWSTQVVAAKGTKALEKARKLCLKKEARERDESDFKSIDTLLDQQQTGKQEYTIKDEDGDDKMDVDTINSPASSSANDHPKPQNYHEGLASAKQLSESVSDFLTRLPPSTTTFSVAGDAWIWIANPYPRHPRHRQAEDIPTFRQLGSRLLENYLTRKAEVESANPGKPAGSITRMLRTDRLNLESDIRELAQARGITNGKWMLFPKEDDIDKVWEIVANAVWEGKLGMGAKVATAKDHHELAVEKWNDIDGGGGGSGARDARDQNQRLICIYTHDFGDKSDVLRVLCSIKDLGLLNLDGFCDGTRMNGGGTGGLKIIYYKCDAYTWLDINSSNEYKLKASMFCSRDMVPEWYRGGGSGGGGFR